MDIKIHLSASRLQGVIAVCLLLTIITLATFWNVQNYDFVFDDKPYVTDNIQVKAGFTKAGMLWALRATDGGSWHPLTWFSLFLDHELYGLNAGGYHWTNLLFHLSNSLLLFLLLNRTTGALHCSAFVAALFALHPLHVESVAWISERKDVLSTFFWLLTMWFYANYANKPVIWKYCLVSGTFILGLMSKPMLVTLPCILLLFDYWPLQRASLPSPKNTLTSLIIEKVPLLVISITIGLLTIYTQRKTGALMAFEALPVNLRVQNAIIVYTEYMLKMVWPQGLAVFYPYFRAVPLVKLAFSAVCLASLSLFVVHKWEKHAYLMVGWLWYIVTLLPVIGIIQVGRQAMADRYTYVPLIGLFIMIAWGIQELLKQRRYKKILFTGGTVAMIIILMAISWTQTQVWHNSITLFTHAINVTPKNYLAHGNLAVALADRQDYAAALNHYREALRIKPDYALAHINLGDLLFKCGKSDEAMQHFRASLRINPDNSSAQRHLADALVKKGQLAEAVSLYNQALRAEPDNPELYNNLGVALAQQNKDTAAVQCFASALRINPGYAEARNNLKLLMSKTNSARRP